LTGGWQPLSLVVGSLCLERLRLSRDRITKKVDEEVKNGFGAEDRSEWRKIKNSEKEGLMSSGRKTLVFFLVVAFLVMAMGGIASAQQKANVVVKEWRIPTIFFLSGPMAGFAEPHKWLADKLVADINAAGGIAGKPVVLDYCDSGLDPTKATACIAKAIDSGALLMMGPLNDMEMKASMPLAVRTGIFSFSGTCTETIAKQFYPWTIYSLPSPEVSEKIQMEMWLKHEPDIKSVTALEEPLYPMIHALSEGYQKNLAAKGIKVNGIIQAPSGMVDYNAIVVKALATRADAFTYGGTEGVGAKLIKGLVAQGIKPSHIYTMSGVVGPSFLQEAKGSMEGVYTPTSPYHSPTPAAAKYLKEYKDSHNGKGYVGYVHVTYDMVMMIKQAIEATGVTGDPAKLKEERAKIKDYAINQKGFKGMNATYDVEKGLAVRYPEEFFQVKSSTEVPLIETVKP
jgi:branched-chain amino acid transport system substrate-binding protein